MKYFVLLFSLIFLNACGGGHNPDKALKDHARKVGASSYEEISPGKWKMVDILKDVATGANFEVSFSLADHGAMTVHAFANSSLHDGLDIKFVRNAATLGVFVSVGSEVQDWSSYFTTVDATQSMTFTFDIHNDERPAHILVWQGSKNAGLNHRNTIYNSGEDSVDLGYAGSPGNGAHRNWGISFSNAEITNALSSEPQETHE